MADSDVQTPLEDAPGPVVPLNRFIEDYGPYLGRIRLLLQRYVLALETTGRPSGASLSDVNTASMDDVALRCLFDTPLSERRQLAISELNIQLQATSYDALSLGGGGGGLFEQVRWEFGLSNLACDSLWLMLAGKLVPEFLWLYRTLWGDTDRSLFDRTFLFHVLDPFADNLPELFGIFDPGAPMFAQRLVVELRRGDHEEADGLLAPSRRLIRHLLGLETGLPNVEGFVAVHPPATSPGDVATEAVLDKSMLKRLRIGFAGKRRFLLIGSDNTGPIRLARKIMSDQGAPLIEAEVPGLVAGGEAALVLLLGEAKLRRAGIYLDRIEVLDREETPLTFTRQLFELMSGIRLPLFFRATYGLSARTRLRLADELGAIELRLQLPDPAAREKLWKGVLASHFEDPEIAHQVAFTARAYPFGMDEIESAVSLARLQAIERDIRQPALRPSDVEAACHNLSGQNMGQLAQRVKVTTDWDHVILTKPTQSVIDEMLTYGRYQSTVFEEQGYGLRTGYAKGLTALFWGPPGTGKTLVSGLLSRELGLELYRIELSQVVSKYIGETEQRLAQIFDESVVSGMALLFDEADALFAKRTEVKSSVDRYANLEVNFLLQRIEHHNGVVILTTNFPKSIDEAFMRRIRFKAEFPAPGPEERSRLWAAMIPEMAPREADIRFDDLGEVFELTGGEIRNAVLRAAFYAVDEGLPLSTTHLDRAAQVEYREAGRLVRTTAMQSMAKRAALKKKNAEADAEIELTNGAPSDK